MLGCLLFSGCARVPESAPSFAPASSAYSASFSEASQSFAVPSHEPIFADVIVRPDLLAINFAVRSAGKSPEEALAAAKTEVDTIRGKIASLGGASSLRLCGFRSERDSEEKARAIVDGVVEISLDASTDYWARAAMMAKVSAMTTPLEAPSKKALDEGSIAAFSSPKFLLRDPEKYRAELTKKWVERAKVFAQQAEEGRAPLSLVRCEPPQQIAQSAISFEEIALSLRMACQLDAVAAK